MSFGLTKNTDCGLHELFGWLVIQTERYPGSQFLAASCQELHHGSAGSAVQQPLRLGTQCSFTVYRILKPKIVWAGYVEHASDLTQDPTHGL